jgi:hypothetical protein
MDFVSARLANGRWFQTLTVLDRYTRESLAHLALLEHPIVAVSIGPHSRLPLPFMSQPLPMFAYEPDRSLLRERE